MNKQKFFIIVVTVLVAVALAVGIFCLIRGTASQPSAVTPDNPSYASPSLESSGQSVQSEESAIPSGHNATQGSTADRSATADSSGTATVPSAAGSTVSSSVSGILSAPSSVIPVPTESNGQSDEALTYEAYLALTPAQQQAYYESYETLDEFAAWYNTAKAAYDQAQSNIVVSGGSINLEDYVD